MNGYQKAKNAKGLARVKEKMGDYNEVIQVLCTYNHIIDALKHAAKYEDGNISLPECYSLHYMASEYAEKLLKSEVLNNQASLEQFETVLKYLAPSERVRYYKAAHMHKQACEVLKRESESKFCDVFRIYKAQGWYEDGIHLAKELGKSKDEATFVLFKATAELAETPGNLQESTISMLQDILDKPGETSAAASLLYGGTTQNHAIIKAARDFYSTSEYRNSFGQIEAISTALAGAEYNCTNQMWENIRLLNKNEDLISLVFTVCKEIRRIVIALDPTNKSSVVQCHLINQLENFYGLEKKNEMYSVPCSSYPWTNQLLKEVKEETRMKDEDGMIQIAAESIFKGLQAHMEGLTKTWISNDEHSIVEHFIELFSIHENLHHEMTAGGYLHQAYSEDELELKKNYPSLLCNAFELTCYGNDRVGTKSGLLSAFVASISPQATCYLPFTSQIPSDTMISTLTKLASDVLKNSDQAFDFNKWITAWLVNCVSREGSKKMKEELNRRSQEISQDKLEQAHKHLRVRDEVYILDCDKKYQHLILLWLRTCELLHDKKVLASSTVFVYTILRHIASNHFIHSSVSITNLLNLVTIHTTAILTMQAACSARFHSDGNIYLPRSYENVVHTFQNMVGSFKSNFFQSCVQYVMARKRLSKVQFKLKRMLIVIFDVMTGTYDREYNPLKDAVSKEECLKNGEAHHCLVFVLTLFCNIALLVKDSKKLLDCRSQIYDSVKHCQEPMLMGIYCRFLNSNTVLDCFIVLEELLGYFQDSLCHIKAAHNHLFQGSCLDVSQPFKGDQVIRRVNKLYPLFPFPLAYHQYLPGATAVKLKGKMHEISQILSSMDSVEDNKYSPEVSEVSIFRSQPTTSCLEEGTEWNFIITCHICACQLEGTSIQSILTEGNAMDLYHDHCKTEDHRRKLEVKKIFDMENEIFQPKKKRLCEMLPQCTSLLKFQQKQTVREVIDTIQMETENIDKNISQIRSSGEWKKGEDLLKEDHQEKIRSLCRRASDVITKTEERKQVIEQEKEKEKMEKEKMVNDEQQPDRDEDIDNVLLMNKVSYNRQRSKEYSRKQKKYKRTRSKKLIKKQTNKKIQNNNC